MKKWLGIFLVLVILALFSFGCAGVSKNSAGFTSDENDGFESTKMKAPNYYQMHGY